MSDDEILEVVMAHKEGKKIECREICLRENGRWLSVTPLDYVRWDFEHFRYRVAPEPRKPREWRVFVSGGEIQSCLTRDPSVSPQGQILVREVLENE